MDTPKSVGPKGVGARARLHVKDRRYVFGTLAKLTGSRATILTDKGQVFQGTDYQIAGS